MVVWDGARCNTNGHILHFIGPTAFKLNFLRRAETFLKQFSSYSRTGKAIKVTSHPLWATYGLVRVVGLAAMTTSFGSRMNGTTQEEAPRFQRAPEVFKVHRLPGHL